MTIAVWLVNKFCRNKISISIVSEDGESWIKAILVVDCYFGKKIKLSNVGNSRVPVTIGLIIEAGQDII